MVGIDPAAVALDATVEQLAALENATRRVRAMRQIDEHVRTRAVLANLDLHTKSTRRVPYAMKLSTALPLIALHQHQAIAYMRPTKATGK